MRFKTILLVLVCGSLTACVKDQTFDKEENPYDEFLNTIDENGNITFYNSGAATSTDKTEWSVVADIYDNVTDRNPISANVYINDTCVVSPVYTLRLKQDIAGAYVHVAFKQKANMTSFYIPQNFKLLSPIFTSSTDNTLSPTTILKWEPDTQNACFLRLKVEELNGDGTNKIVTNTIDIPDNGTFQLTKDLFKGINAGDSVVLYIDRHNYSIFESCGEKYSLWAYSLRSIFGIYK